MTLRPTTLLGAPNPEQRSWALGNPNEIGSLGGLYDDWPQNRARRLPTVKGERRIGKTGPVVNRSEAPREQRAVFP